MNTTSTVTAISETPKHPQQRQTAKDIIAANVKSLIEQLEGECVGVRRDEPLPQLQLWKHSGDCTAATHGNPSGWAVRMEPARPEGDEGAETHSDTCPIVGIKRKKDEEANKDVTKQNTRVLVGFRNAYVFDVEQTKGVELPTLREMTGTVGENRARLVSFIEAQGIELAFTEKIAPLWA